MTNSAAPEAFPHVEMINDIAATTSREIARHFNKAHQEIVADIESLPILAIFIKSNFYKIPECKETTYYVTKEGLFLLLLFGFSCRQQPHQSQIYLLAFDYLKASEVNLPEVSIESPPPPVEYPQLQIVNGVAMTTSLDVAKYFDKLHKNVLQSIKEVDCSEEFSRLNFQPTSYSDQQGKERLMYHLTKDGFIFLVMGFTGEKAAQIKEAYIAAFNQMEAELTRRSLEHLKFFLLNATTESEQAEMRFSHTLQQHEKQLQKHREMYEQIRRNTVEMVSKIYALSAKGFLQTDISAITGYREDLVTLAMQLKTF